jgi:hypothetical protein
MRGKTSLPPTLFLGPTSPLSPPQIAEAVEWLKSIGRLPTHMSSDAGSHVAKRPPSAAWSASPQRTRNTTSAIVVTYGLYVPGLTPPLLVFMITAIDFLGKLIGAVLMAFLRSCFSPPITALMDCLSVIKVVKKGWTLKSAGNPQEHRAYGILVSAIFQATAPNQPRIAWIEAHPEKARKTTSTRPGRPPIPRSDWTRENHLNVLADLYLEPSIPATLDHTTIPLKIVTMTAFEQLNAIMPLDSLY